LSAPQLRALELDLVGVATKDIAREVNVVEGTVRNWRVLGHPYAAELARMRGEIWEEFRGRMTTLNGLALARVEASLRDPEEDVRVALKYLATFGREVLANPPSDPAILEMVLGAPVKEDRLACWKLSLEASRAASPEDGVLGLDEFVAAAVTSLRASCLALCRSDGEGFRALLATPAVEQQAVFEKATWSIKSGPSAAADLQFEDDPWFDLEILVEDMRLLVPRLLQGVGERVERESAVVTEVRAALERDAARLNSLWPALDPDDLEQPEEMDAPDPLGEPGKEEFDIHDPERCLSLVLVVASLLSTIAHMTLPFRPETH
jgi:hypothetical protein